MSELHDIHLDLRLVALLVDDPTSINEHISSFEIKLTFIGLFIAE